MCRRLETPTLVRGIQNAWTEEPRRNRFANFRLRGVLGMLARARHAACPRRVLAPTSGSPLAPIRVSRLAPTRPVRKDRPRDRTDTR